MVYAGDPPSYSLSGATVRKYRIGRTIGLPSDGNWTGRLKHAYRLDLDGRDLIERIRVTLEYLNLRR